LGEILSKSKLISIKIQPEESRLWKKWAFSDRHYIESWEVLYVRIVGGYMGSIRLDSS